MSIRTQLGPGGYPIRRYPSRGVVSSRSFNGSILASAIVVQLGSKSTAAALGLSSDNTRSISKLYLDTLLLAEIIAKTVIKPITRTLGLSATTTKNITHILNVTIIVSAIITKAIVKGIVGSIVITGRSVVQNAAFFFRKYVLSRRG